MKIYLLRHAIAVERNPNKYPDDALRPLSDAGRKKMARFAKILDKMGLQIDLLLSSPLLRARQTAEIARKRLHLKKNKLILVEALGPAGDPAKLIAEINEKYSVDNLLLVGHEPDLSSLISLLLSGEASLPITLKKAGMGCLSVEKLAAGKCARLEWLFNPDLQDLVKDSEMNM